MSVPIESISVRIEQMISKIGWTESLLGIAVFIFSYTLLRIIWFVMDKGLYKMAGKTKSNVDDLIVSGMQKPINFLIILVSAYLAFAYSFPDLQVSGKTLNELALLFAIAWAAFASNRFIHAILLWYDSEISNKTESKFGKQIFPFVKKMVWIVIYGIAALIVLDMFGVQIAPLLAGLGIAGLAVALALQESLANFFAGIYIIADKPIRPGDFIELEDGKSGYVEEVGWRSTRIRMLANNTILIPNSKLAQSTIINYYLPSKKSALLIKLGVDYSTDIDVAEKILITSAKKVLSQVKGGVKDFEPFVRFNNFGDHALELTLITQVEEIVDQYLVGHELRKEILRNFRKNKINIPFPVRTVYLHKTK